MIRNRPRTAHFIPIQKLEDYKEFDVDGIIIIRVIDMEQCVIRKENDSDGLNLYPIQQTE